jgi:uncharacterized protein YacL (UPF0231 family)
LFGAVMGREVEGAVADRRTIWSEKRPQKDTKARKLCQLRSNVVRVAGRNRRSWQRATRATLVVDAIEIGQVAAGIEIVSPGIAFVFRYYKAEPLVEIGENDFLLLFRYW